MGGRTDSRGSSSVAERGKKDPPNVQPAANLAGKTQGDEESQVNKKDGKLCDQALKRHQVPTAHGGNELKGKTERIGPWKGKKETIVSSNSFPPQATKTPKTKGTNDRGYRQKLPKDKRETNKFNGDTEKRQWMQNQNSPNAMSAHT